MHILLEAGANADKADEAWRTPLHIAAQKGMVEIVRSLLQAEADMHRAVNDSSLAIKTRIRVG